jgi:hypothetical protein
MYLHYEILLSGYKSIYLRKYANWKFKRIKKHFDSIIYVFYRSTRSSNDYVHEMTDTLLMTKPSLALMQISRVLHRKGCQRKSVYNSIKELTEILKICLTINYIC